MLSINRKKTYLFYYDNQDIHRQPVRGNFNLPDSQQSDNFRNLLDGRSRYHKSSQVIQARSGARNSIYPGNSSLAASPHWNSDLTGRPNVETQIRGIADIKLDCNDNKVSGINYD